MKAAKQLTAIIGALALCGALSACGGTATMAQQEHVITVNASAQVKVAPDKASFSVEILTQGTTPEEASAANAAPVNAVIDALELAGVAEEDIQTTYTDLSPVYGMAEEPVSDGMAATVVYTGGNEIVGYHAVSTLMDTCITAGATGVDGPRYYVSSYDEAYNEALTQAIAASREKAQVMAAAAGVTLGSVVNITEGYQYTGYRYASNEAAVEADEAGGMASMKIAPGQVDIEAQVTVSYAI